MMIQHTFKLLNRGAIDPRWMNSFRGAVVIVEDPRQVVVDGLTLFLDSGEPDLPLGEKVKVWLGRWFYCETVDYIEYQESERKREAEEKERLRFERIEQMKKEAEAFNQSLNIPVRWRPGIKDVLSGLSEYSDGSGMRSSTVFHIELLEPLQAGRLKRDTGEFLCTKYKGKQWSNNSAEYGAKVTCKACIKSAQRWNK